MATSFKGVHYPKSVILYAVYFYVKYAVSYRDPVEIMAERGVEVDHADIPDLVGYDLYGPKVAPLCHELLKRLIDELSLDR